MRFRGIIFDMDGTLTVPAIDFNRIRRELAIPPDVDIMTAIEAMTEEQQRAAWSLIECYEDEVSMRNRLHPGVREIFAKLAANDIRTAILTRNSSRSVELFLQRFNLEVDFYLSREFAFVKPSPEPVLHLLERFRLPPEACLVVGDYIHDLECGAAVGCKTCFFHNSGHSSYAEHADYSVCSYRELDVLVFGNQADSPR